MMIFLEGMLVACILVNVYQAIRSYVWRKNHDCLTMRIADGDFERPASAVGIAIEYLFDRTPESFNERTPDEVKPPSYD